MGLDMYLKGEKFYHYPRTLKEDGFEVSAHTLELGYWRKHPDLHGYIVQTFAEGVDECQQIELWPDDLDDIMNAVRERRLPHTEGFFFGYSDGDERELDLEVLERAKAWLLREEPGVWKSVYYRARW